jgi:exopolysaccharide biosynthesis polyprenyl glycosylphosphotransferase
MSTDLGVAGHDANLPRRLKWLELRGADGGREPGGTSLGEAGAVAGDPGARRHPLKSQRMALLVWTVVTDAVALGAAFRLAYWVRFDLQITLAPEVVASIDAYLALTAVLVGLWLLVLVPFRLYDLHASHGGPVESARAFNACTMAAMIVVTASFLFPAFVVSRMWLLSAWGLSCLFLAGNRFVVRRLVQAARRRGYLLAPAVIVGTNEEATNLAAFLRDWQASGVRALGFVSTGARDPRTSPGLPVLGSVADIATIVGQHEVEDVIVAITSLSRDELLQLSEDVDALPVELRLSSGLYEMLTTRVSVRTVGTVPLMSLQKNRLNRTEAAAKALLDRSLALLGLLFLSPVMLAVALAIKLDSRGPAFHRRRVLGVRGREFDAFKFRTMFVNGEDILRRHPGAAQELSVNHKLKDDPRITKVGRWLRKYSLDELPQLVNVLAGQMALVGPRMITVEEGAKYGWHRMNLLTVKPGITGLWQVSGRSDLTYEERVRIDMYYVRHYSIWLDLQILFIQTPPAVLRSRGAY